MKIIKLIGTVEVITGLHIGGGDDTMKIGGIDNGVVKDANSKMPYIPGSSLKGKMRSLLEWDNRLVGYGNGKPFSSSSLDDIPQPDRENAQTLLKLFGDSGESNHFGITRISVGDCKMIEVKNQIYSEAKYENVIDRQKGTAQHPRQTERVPAGVKFEVDIRVKILDEKDSEDAFKKMICRGIALVESDYLGGSGSRGYGRVKFDVNWSE